MPRENIDYRATLEQLNRYFPDKELLTWRTPCALPAIRPRIPFGSTSRLSTAGSTRQRWPVASALCQDNPPKGGIWSSGEDGIAPDLGSGGRRFESGLFHQRHCRKKTEGRGRVDVILFLALGCLQRCETRPLTLGPPGFTPVRCTPKIHHSTRIPWYTAGFQYPEPDGRKKSARKSGSFPERIWKVTPALYHKKERM